MIDRVRKLVLFVNHICTYMSDERDRKWQVIDADDFKTKIS